MGKGKKKAAADPRVEGIGTVGGITLAALGICIPLTAIAGKFAGWLSLAIPVTVLLGAGILAVRIWSSGEKQVNQRDQEALSAHIKELEERLANLEMVDSLEAHFAEKHRLTAASGDPPEASPTMGPGHEKTAS